MLGAVGGPGLPMIERGFRSRWYELLTRAELALEDQAAAERWATLAEESAAGLEIHGRTCEALRARAFVGLAARRRCRRRRGGAARDGRGGGLGARDRGRAVADPRGPGPRRGRVAPRRRPLSSSARTRRSRSSAPPATPTRRPRSCAASASASPGAAGARRSPTPTASAALSKREREVAELIADGRANKEIAAELFLSERTVETHLTRSFAKLGLSNRAQLAALVAEERG